MADEELSPARVGRYYDEWTERYRACFGDTLQACRPTQSDDLHAYVLERAGILDGDRILDAGCGVCGPSIYFARHRDVSIDAVTVSREQVATSRRLVAEAGVAGRISVHLADFHRLDELFPAATFHRALFLESLSHAQDPTAPLTSVFNALAPGGVVYIKDFFEKQAETAQERSLVRETIERVDRTFVLKTPTLQRTVAALVHVGFKQRWIEPVGFSTDNSVWIRFNDTHRFDLYDGKPPFQWCDWLELAFEKPTVSDPD